MFRAQPQQSRVAGKRLIFGCGTGRCGTMSLHTLLSRQDDVEITAQAPWTFQSWPVDPPELGQAVLGLLQRQATFVGDVAPWWLGSARLLVEMYAAKIIVMMAQSDQVVDGHLKLRFDHWSYYPPESNPPCVSWVRSLPKFGGPEAPDRKANAEAAWGYYAKAASLLEQEYPANVSIVQMEALNNEQWQEDIIRWLGFPHPCTGRIDHKYPWKPRSERP